MEILYGPGRFLLETTRFTFASMLLLHTSADSESSAKEGERKKIVVGEKCKCQSTMTPVR